MAGSDLPRPGLYGGIASAHLARCHQVVLVAGESEVVIKASILKSPLYGRRKPKTQGPCV